MVEKASKLSPARLALDGRAQTGVWLDKRILKVLKAIAAMHDLSLGALLEGMMVRAFEGRPVFAPGAQQRVRDLCKIYGVVLDEDEEPL
jgi:hypothetical protein